MHRDTATGADPTAVETTWVDGERICAGVLPVSDSCVRRAARADADRTREYMRAQELSRSLMLGELALLEGCGAPFSARSLGRWLEEPWRYPRVWRSLHSFWQQQAEAPERWYECDAAPRCPFESLDPTRVEQHEQVCLHCRDGSGGRQPTEGEAVGVAALLELGKASVEPISGSEAPALGTV